MRVDSHPEAEVDSFHPIGLGQDRLNWEILVKWGISVEVLSLVTVYSG
jgi:hypothetical protein